MQKNTREHIKDAITGIVSRSDGKNVSRKGYEGAGGGRADAISFISFASFARQFRGAWRSTNECAIRATAIREDDGIVSQFANLPEMTISFSHAQAARLSSCRRAHVAEPHHHGAIDALSRRRGSRAD